MSAYGYSCTDVNGIGPIKLGFEMYLSATVSFAFFAHARAAVALDDEPATAGQQVAGTIDNAGGATLVPRTTLARSRKQLMALCW